MKVEKPIEVVQPEWSKKVVEQRMNIYFETGAIERLHGLMVYAFDRGMNIKMDFDKMQIKIL